MKKIKTGDIVGRISYNSDVLFKVKEVIENSGKDIALLKGVDVRLLADSPLEDLEIKDPQEILVYRHKMIKRNNERMRKIITDRHVRRKAGDFLRLDPYCDDTDKQANFFEVPGRVIHLDGDEEYLQKCMRSYIQMGIPARGFFVAEKDQPKRVKEILAEHTADILVLTGHDGVLKGTTDFSRTENYRNSKYFAEAVRAARKADPSRDGLVIFAGACQSHYESLLEAGANFASSPQRVMIHAFDPVFLVEKVAYTPFSELLCLKDIIENTITGEEGIGGIETQGRFRLGYPKSPY